MDKDGLIRYTHFGEGAYEETELWIRGLLIEAGADLEGIPSNTIPEPRHAVNLREKTRETGLTREIYAGFERNYNALLSSAPYVLHQEYYEEESAELFYTDPATTRITSSTCKGCGAMTPSGLCMPAPPRVMRTTSP